MARSRDIEYRVGFTGDTSQLEAAIKKATESLNKLGTNPKNLQKGLEGASRAALDLSNHLNNAFNANTGKLDLIQFRQEIEKGGMSIQDYATRLSSLGPEGEQAFMQVASAIGAAELPLRRTNELFDKLWITLKNTARWRLTTGAINALVGGMQQAYGYAKSLDASLNNIRIVTNKSAEDMAKFATQANKAAQALSTTTTAYTDASLIYYQQGLNDEEVKARTDTTIRMANVTGQSAETISSQMTAIWNNFDDGTRSLESYADSMVALGASTATSSKEIVEGLEKFAPVAETVGLSFDYASAALATITATTRESASVAGTALKTLFSRLEGLKLGETLDDGTDLNKYSNALLAVGVNIKDVNGELKNMDTILDELGARWQTLSKDQQMALAETVGGVRQYAQLVALMDNWDFFQSNLAISRGAEGSLQQQANIYAESWEAARDRVKTATENIYDSLINPEQFIGIDKAITPVLNVISSVVDAFGGLTGILPVVVLLMNKIYGDKIAQSMRDFVINIGLMTGAEQERARALQAAFVAETKQLSLDYEDNVALSTKLRLLSSQTELQGIINGNAESLSSYQLDQINNEQKILDLLQQEVLQRTDNIEKLTERKNEAETNLGFSFISNENYTTEVRDALYKVRTEVQEQAKKENIALPLKFTVSNTDVSKTYNSLKNNLDEILNKYQNVIAKSNQLKSFSWVAQSKKELIDFLKSIDEYSSAMDNMSKDELVEIVKNLKNEAKAANISIDALKEAMSTLGMDQKDIDEYIRLVKKLQNEEKLTADETQRLTQLQKELREKIENQKIPDYTDWAQMLVSVGNAIAQVAMGIRSIDNLGKIFSDDTLSKGEKATQLLTTLSMLLPVVGAATKSWGAFTEAGGIKAAFGLTTAAGGTMTLGAAITTALPIAAALGVAIYALGKIIASFITTEKEAAESLKKSSEAYQQEADKLKELNNELETTKQKIEELQQLAANNEISIAQREELENLKQQNAELERKIELQKVAEAGALVSRISDIKKNGIKGTKFSGPVQNEVITEALNDFNKEAEILITPKIAKLDNSEVQSLLSNLSSEIAGGSFKSSKDLHEYKDWLLTYLKDELEVSDDVLAAATEIANELTVAGDKAVEIAHSAWVNENIDKYQEKADQYNDLIRAIDLGLLSETDEKFIALQEDLIEARKEIYDTNYEETFLDPIINQLSQNDLGKIISGQALEISSAGKKILRNNAVTTQEIIDQYSKIYSNAKTQLSKFGLESLSDSLNYQQLTLIAKMSGDPAYNDFKAFYTALQAESGVISVVLQVDAIKSASVEALEHLSTGDLLDEELITKLQDAYQNVYDLSNIANWSVEKQIEFLSNNTLDQIIAQQEAKIEKLRQDKDRLGEDISKTQEQLAIFEEGASTGVAGLDEEIQELHSTLEAQSNLEIIANVNLDAAEKELEALKEKVEKDPWKITLDTGEDVNVLAAQLNNAKAALKLINEDLSVDAKNLVELGKRFPEALVNAAYDAEQNILKINKDKYDILKQYADEELDHRRDNAVQELLNESIAAEAILDLVSAEEDAKKTASKNTLEAIKVDEGEKIQIAGQAAFETVMAVVKSEIQKRQEELTTMTNSQAASKATTDIASKNAQIMADNYAAAATAIVNAFDQAFQAIANGSGILVDPTKGYTSIATEGIAANAKMKSGEVGGFDAAKAAIISSPEYQSTSREIKNLQILEQLLTGYQNGEKSWGEVSRYFSALSNIPSAAGAIEGFSQGIIQLFQGGDFLNNGDAAITAAENLINDPALKDIITGNIDKIRNEITDAIAKLLGSETTDKTKGGGGGGKSSKAEDTDKAKEVERYHEITREIERQKRALSELEKQISRTYGTQRLKQYEQQLEILSKEIAAQQEKLRQAQEWLIVDRQKLVDMGLELNIDEETGEILNYTQLLNEARDAYIAAATEYNNLIAAESEAVDEALIESLKEMVDQAKERFDLIQQALQQYESTLDLTHTMQDNIAENRRKEEDIKLDEITYKIKLVLDVRDARKALYSFGKEIAESFGDALTHGIQVALFDEKSAQEEMAMYQHYVEEYNALRQRLAEANEYTNTDAIIEELKNLEQNIISSGEALLEWLETVENMYVDALNAAAERFNWFTNQIAHDTEVIGLIKELYTLQGVTYKTEEGFQRLQEAAQGEYQGYLRQAELNKQWYDEASARLEEAEAKLAGVSEDDVQYDALKKNRDALLEEANRAQKAMLENSKAAMEAAKQMYLDQIDRMSYEMEQKLSNGMGFDLMQDKYEHMLEENDRYLDTVEEGLKTATWYAKLQKDIDKTNNNAYKERLKDLQKEIDLRREENTLSEYDLKILEARYQVLQAQAALEDEQNNKTKLRLVRDSNGNWNYQYTADLGNIQDKEQDLLKAKQNEYEITKQQVRELEEELMKLPQAATQAVTQVYKDLAEGILSEDEANAKLEELQRYYTTKAEYLQRELGLAREDMASAAVTSQVLAAGLSESVFNTSDATIKKIVEVFQQNGSQQLLTEASTTLGELQLGLIPYLEEFANTTDNVKEKIWGIIFADGSQNGLSIHELINTLQDSGELDDLANALETWGGPFTEQSDQIRDALKAIIDGDGDKGSLKYLKTEFTNGRDSLYDILINGNDSLLKRVDELKLGFQGDISAMVDSISTKLIPTIDSAIPAMGAKFDEFKKKIEDTAEAIGVSPNNLDDMVQNLTDDIEDLYDSGYDAVSMMWDQLDAIWNLQSAYLDWADAVMEVVYAMQQLASQTVSVIENQPSIPTPSPVENNTNNDDEEEEEEQGQAPEEPTSTGDDGSSGGTNPPPARHGWKVYAPEGARFETFSNLTGYQTPGGLIATLYDDDPSAESWKNSYESLGATIVRFGSGGYTGDWNDGRGRLAFLHQKELVLNEDDTQKILEAVHVIRGISDTIFKGIADQLDSAGIASMALLGSHLGSTQAAAATGTLEQHVTIEQVNFPGVTSSREIEEAFENLVNDAAQWARRRKG